MPKIFEWNGYRFFFFSNEGLPLERCHIHVRKDENRAKFWVDPEVVLADSWGINPADLNKLESKVEENSDLIRRKWDEYFNQ